MNKRPVCVALISASIAALFSVGAIAQGQGQGQGSAPVTIVGPLPLPVTGSTTVSGTVAVSNTPLPVSGTVGLTSGAAVTIANTATNPVLVRDVGADPGRIAYQAPRGIICDGHDCNFTFSEVPAGHRLVIQYISGGLVFNNTPSNVKVDVFSNPTNPFPGLASFLAPVVGAVSLFGQSILYYVDAGSTPQVNINVGNFSNFNGINSITLMGYLLDCNVSPCSPIAR